MASGGCVDGCVWDSSSHSTPGLWAVTWTGGAILLALSRPGEAARVLDEEQELEEGADGEQWELHRFGVIIEKTWCCLGEG